MILLAFNHIVLGFRTDTRKTNSVPNYGSIGTGSRSGQMYICENYDQMDQEDRDNRICFQQKWYPLPDLDREPMNVRACCYFFDTHCLFDKMVTNYRQLSFWVKLLKQFSGQSQMQNHFGELLQKTCR